MSAPAIITALIALTLFGQPQGPKRPDAAGRSVYTFDFEERLSNPNPVPRNWSRVYDQAEGGHRPLLPPWNQAELAFTGDGQAAASGEGYVRLPTQGGGTRLLLDSGVVPVFAGADYLVTAKVRTDGLARARGRLVARFLDRSGKAIPASDRAGVPFSSQGTWTTIAVEVLGDAPQAAYLQIQLDLLQPAPGGGAIEEQDYSGSASFDDIAIVQLPRAELIPAGGSSASASDKPLTLTALVRDLTGEKLSIDIDVYDARGVRVDHASHDLASGLEQIPCQPRLPGYGWYRAIMTVRSGGEAIGGDSVDLVRFPPLTASHLEAMQRLGRQSSPDRSRFGLDAGALPEGLLPALPALARDVGAGSMSLRVDRDSDALAKTVFDLAGDWREVTLVVPTMPGEADHSASPLEQLALGRAMPAPMASLLDRFGQRVQRWQLSPMNWDAAALSGETSSAACKALAKYVAGPVVVVPSRLDDPVGPSPARDALLHVPGALTPVGVGQSLANLVRPEPAPGERQGVTLAFPCQPPDRLSPRDAAGELVKRVVEAWAAGGDNVPNLVLFEPWSTRGTTRPRVTPRPELAAWRTLVDELSDRRVVSVFPAPEGVRALLLAPAEGVLASRGSAIVAWNESNPGAPALVGYLGAGPVRVVDVFGNSAPAPSEPLLDGKGTGVRVPLGNEPVFVEGIDTELARFLAGFRLEPPVIEPGSTGRQHELVIANPFPTGLTGAVTILQPARDEGDGHAWRITPRLSRFTAGARSEVRVPITIAAGSGLELGPKDFVFQVDLSADRPIPSLEVRRTMSLAMTRLKVDLTYRRQNGNDLVLEVTITNTAEGAVDLSMTSFAPGQPRQPASISDLPPQSQVIRRFVYPGLADALKGQRLSVSVGDVQGASRISTSIAVD